MGRRAASRWARGPWRWVALTLLVLQPLSLAGARSPLAQPSSATGRAQVIAQGVVTLPGPKVVWRLVVREAKPRGEAQPGTRVLGFVLAIDELILLTDVTVDGPVDVARVAPGEFYLVREGTRQIRASLTDAPVSYGVLELVPVDHATDVGAGTLLSVSNPLDAPSGKRDFDLVGNTLLLGEQATVPNTGQPILVCVAAGTIEVRPAGGAPIVLKPFEFAVLDPGEVIITAVPAGISRARALPLTQEVSPSAAFVVAVFGPEIPPLPR